MIIRDVYYNITSVHYSVHYKTRDFKRVNYTFLTYTCIQTVIIVKSYTKFGHFISQYYSIPIITSKMYLLNSNSE